MTRSDDLAKEGAQRLGGGGSAPFIKWGDDYAYVEGQIVDYWTGQYGAVAVMVVEKTSGNLIGELSDEDGKKTRESVTAGDQINIGLKLAALKGITESVVGRALHVAFEGWAESKGGDQFRQFAVYDLGKTNSAPVSGEPINRAKQNELWKRASKLDWSPFDATEGLKNLIAEVKGIKPDEVKLAEIKEGELPAISQAIKRYEREHDDLPF